MPYDVSVTFRGEEVQHPVARALVCVLMLVWGVSVFLITFLAWTLMVTALIVLSPLFYVVHVALRAYGRYGFGYYDRYQQSWEISINSNSFRKILAEQN